MFYNSLVEIHRVVRTKNEYFESIISYEALQSNLEVDIQPYNSQLSLSEYGYKEECNYRMFCDVVDIKVTDKIISNGREFIAKSVVVWDSHMEVLLWQI